MAGFSLSDRSLNNPAGVHPDLVKVVDDWCSFKDGPHFQLPWKQYPVYNTPSKE